MMNIPQEILRFAQDKPAGCFYVCFAKWTEALSFMRFESFVVKKVFIIPR